MADKRTDSLANFSGLFEVFDGLTPYTFSTETMNVQTVSTNGNPGYRHLSRAAGDVGGAFKSEKSLYASSVPKASISGLSGRYFRGYQLPLAPAQLASGFSLSTWNSTSQTALLGQGTTAIARTLPTNPNVSLPNFVGELYRDGIPSAIGASTLRGRLKDYRSLGDEYLNIEFGWKPFLADLQGIAQSVMDSEKILSQLHRDANTLVRRRYDFPSTVGTAATLTPNTRPWPGGTFGKWAFGGSAPIGTLTISESTSVDTWFSGAYRFYLPLGDSQVDRFRRFSTEANKLLGLRLTPEVVWNLTPWTWLGDWVSNIGDVIHNISAFSQDDLVMKYGYIMQHTNMQRHATMTLKTPRSDGASVYNLTYFLDRKIRMKGTPYGFAADWLSFSPRQLAILGALGISNSPRISF